LAAAVAGWRIFDNVLTVPSRQRTIAALVEAVGGPRLAHDDALAASRRIAADYESALPSRRRATDEVLSALQRESFADAPTQARVQLLRSWARDARKRHLADHAVALAASGFGPAGDDFRSVPVRI
jgi:hypothetical protein